MPSIWDVAKAVRESDLPAPARHIMNTLGLMATVETAVVPYEYGPSLTNLARVTGLGRSTVARELAGLEAGGWIVRDRPSIAKARAEKARTQYRLSIPASPALGLVPLRDQSSSPIQGLASPAQGPELVPQRDLASPTAGHVTTKSTTKTTNTSSPASRTQRKRKTTTAEDDENAGLITRGWIDYCAAKGVKLPSRLIGQYAKAIKVALDDGFTPTLIKKALDSMLADNSVYRPSLLDNRLVAIQTGPERYPARVPAQAAPSTAPVAIPTDERCPKHRGETLRNCRRCAANAKARPQVKEAS